MTVVAMMCLSVPHRCHSIPINCRINVTPNMDRKIRPRQTDRQIVNGESSASTDLKGACLYITEWLYGDTLALNVILEEEYCQLILSQLDHEDDGNPQRVQHEICQTHIVPH